MTKPITVDKETGEVLEENNDVRLTVTSPHINRLAYGLQIESGITKEEWTAAFLKVKDLESLSQWFIGDLMIKAKEMWEGEMYDKMIAATGYEYQTLANLLYVASAFSPSDREYVYNEVFSASAEKLSKLSVSHFIRVAPLMLNTNTKGFAFDFLIRAGKEGWTRDTLIEQIRQWKERQGLVQPREEEAESKWADGWNSVKEAGVKSVVTVPEIIDYDDNYFSESDRKTAAIQFYKYELENLLEVLEDLDDDRFTALHDRIRRALGGI